MTAPTDIQKGKGGFIWAPPGDKEPQAVKDY